MLVTFSDGSKAGFKVGLNALDFLARTRMLAPDIANGEWKTLRLPAVVGAMIAFQAILAPATGTSQ